VLTKILFTLAVILVVALVFRVKTTKGKPIAQAAPTRSGVSAAVVAYTLLGLVVAVSALVFVLHWQDQREIINIQVTAPATRPTRRMSTAGVLPPLKGAPLTSPPVTASRFFPTKVVSSRPD